MSHALPESDWKLFRQLREVALERFCERVVEEVHPLFHDTSRTYYERYVEVFHFLKERDRALAAAFDDPRRSRMLEQLAAIYSRGLLEPDEFGRFTESTRTAVQMLMSDVAS